MKISIKRNPSYHFSPLRYPGGKSFLFPLISRILLNQNLNNVTYVEPFAGGAGAAIALLYSGVASEIIINDLDRAIYAFWRSAIMESNRFIEKIQKVTVTMHQWKKQREIFNNPSSGLFELGFATFFLNRTNISGILAAGPIGGVRQAGKWKINARFNKNTLIKRIQRLSRYKDRIKISNLDGSEVIKYYIGRKNAFIYLDPPYYGKGAALYLNYYKPIDHNRLAERVNRRPNGNWLITYDDMHEIRQLYSGRRIFEYSLYHNVIESRKAKEIIIMSDSIVEFE